MKSRDELKADLEATEQQIVGAKMSVRADGLKVVKRLCKGFSFTSEILEGKFVENGKSYE